MKTKSLFVLLTLFIFALSISFLAVAKTKVVKLDKNSYPYAPSLLQFEQSKGDFNPPETCAECHPDKYEEWAGSVHSQAFKDPIYQGELNAALKAVGHEIANHCEACHTTAAVAKGEIKSTGLKDKSDLAMAGVSCDVCHSIKGHTGWQTPTHQPENCSLILSPAKDGKDGPVLTKYGPLKPSEECGEDFHECIESPLHMRSELCASCHEVYNYQTHTPIEATYTEWKKGPYSVNDIHCQDCHMVDIETFKRSADKLVRPAMDEYRHYFNGANYLLYYLTELAAKKAGDEELAANVHQKYEMAIQRLQAAAELTVTPVYQKENLTEIKVRVKNIRAGHNLPTSLTNVRQMWLEITATDSKGNVLMSSGTVDSEGNLPENIRIFNSDGQNSKFHFSMDPWEIQSFSRHDTIPPKGYKDVYYGILPSKNMPVTVEVKLRFRQADQKVAEKILGLLPNDIHLDAVYGLKKVPQLPIVDMVTKKVEF